jgi:peroxin-12
VQYLTQHYPRYFLRLLNHHEEFFAFLLLLVERHHLKKHSELSNLWYRVLDVEEATRETRS